MHRWVFVTTLMILLGAVGCNDIPSKTLSATDQYELLSLDPERIPPERINDIPASDRFHVWHVLGRTSIDDSATREKLTNALLAGAREKGIRAEGCFLPRHAIHVIHGEDVHDLAICFQCRWVGMSVNDRKGGGFVVSESPQPVFDDVLRAAGVPLAEKSE